MFSYKTRKIGIFPILNLMLDTYCSTGIAFPPIKQFLEKIG